MYRNRIRPSSLIGELEDFDAAFDRCFGMVAFQMNRHYVDHILRVGRQLTGDDYEAMLIWGVLAHQNVAHLMPPGSDPCSVLNERGRIPDLRRAAQPLRLRDVAQITRIPRETVRRKLEKLAAAGWIERRPDGWVITANHMDTLLREASRENLRRLLTTADEVMRTLREADAQIAAEGVTARTSTGSPAASPTSERPAYPAPAERPGQAG